MSQNTNNSQIADSLNDAPEDVVYNVTVREEFPIPVVLTGIPGLSQMPRSATGISDAITQYHRSLMHPDGPVMSYVESLLREIEVLRGQTARVHHYWAQTHAAQQLLEEAKAGHFREREEMKAAADAKQSELSKQLAQMTAVLANHERTITDLTNAAKQSRAASAIASAKQAMTGDHFRPCGDNCEDDEEDLRRDSCPAQRRPLMITNTPRDEQTAPLFPPGNAYNASAGSRGNAKKHEESGARGGTPVATGWNSGNASAFSQSAQAAQAARDHMDGSGFPAFNILPEGSHFSGSFGQSHTPPTPASACGAPAKSRGQPLLEPKKAKDDSVVTQQEKKEMMDRINRMTISIRGNTTWPSGNTIKHITRTEYNRVKTLLDSKCAR